VLNFGIAADRGYFEEIREGREAACEHLRENARSGRVHHAPPRAPAGLGTVTAMDYNEYSKILND
jgi:hypothetical protein